MKCPWCYSLMTYSTPSWFVRVKPHLSLDGLILEALAVSIRPPAVVETIYLTSGLSQYGLLKRYNVFTPQWPNQDRSTVLWSYLYMEVSGWQWRPEKVAQGVYCHQGPPLMLAKNYRNHFSLFKKRDRFVTAL